MACSGLLLCGGQSSRMGQDKALLKVQGVPLLQRVHQVAHQVLPGSPLYAVTPWPERYQQLLPSCRWVKDDIAQGPLAGFAQGLAVVQTEWVLLLACDLPRLDPQVLLTWRAALVVLPETVLALLPRSQQAWEPLCGFYRRSALASVRAFLHKGGRSFQDWLTLVRVQEAMGAPQEMFFNCNTPQELDRIERGLTTVAERMVH
ncbi:molybdenum cofactor guanylyltransferase [Candidatus Cyanaurora vandensis]|uniref:molybdenum cofactor guanylyltransferase n=1 Tax=Candidatus Cyanaurora vandensis TaxID=2714958 RepID=UPI00257BFC84|nr:molybdenum cofactor guanylyltransferase [Candidatus Cyanaurora vandensis]